MPNDQKQKKYIFNYIFLNIALILKSISFCVKNCSGFKTIF